MNAPFTLRQLTGKPAVPAPLSQSVLVIVDAQNTYRAGYSFREHGQFARAETASS